MTSPTPGCKTARLLAALQREWITPLKAVQAAGILSLSQRCGEFRRKGWTVHDKWVKTRTGSRVKAYFISGRKQAMEAA